MERRMRCFNEGFTPWTIIRANRIQLNTNAIETDIINFIDSELTFLEPNNINTKCQRIRQNKSIFGPTRKWDYSLR